jgi:ribosomal-protein-serine acetyltransferase
VVTVVFAHFLGDGAVLAMLEPWHAQEFLEAVDRSREHLSTYVPAAHNVHSVEDARGYLQRFADGHARDAEHIFGIWLDGKLVGMNQLIDFDAKMGTCEIGVWLADEVQGRGLVTRSCRHLIDWAIGVRGIRRVVWMNHPANVRSSAVARRLGMTREGVLRSSFTLGGRRWDNEVWSVLAEEWPTEVWTPAGSR